MPRPKSTEIIRICESCNQSFSTPLWRVKDGRGRFCSRTCQLHGRVKSLEERFKKYIGETNKNGCIPWIGCTNHAGYGCIRESTKGNNILSHRLSYTFKNGEIPKGKLVLHSCDNPSCINPDHLFLGTDADNVADKVAKGRQPVGEMIRSSKLSEEEVNEIRKQHATGKFSLKKISDKYNLSNTTVWSIVHRRTWKHI